MILVHAISIGAYCDGSGGDVVSFSNSVGSHCRHGGGGGRRLGSTPIVFRTSSLDDYHNEDDLHGGANVNQKQSLQKKQSTNNKRNNHTKVDKTK